MLAGMNNGRFRLTRFGAELDYRGSTGTITPFVERLRWNVVSTWVDDGLVGADDGDAGHGTATDRAPRLLACFVGHRFEEEERFQLA
jgi:hypothetical protein